MIPKLLDAKRYGPEHGLRPNSAVETWPINMIFNQGGLGDFVNYTAATTWIARNIPWVQGRLWCFSYLHPLLKDIHKDFSHWSIHDSMKLGQEMESGTSYLGPNVIVNGVNTTKQFFSPVGAHQIEVAFAYYAGIAPAPKDALLPVLDYEFPKHYPKVKRLNGNYAVIPTGGSAPARTLEGRHINPIIRYIKSRGLTPVFLGKSDILGNGMEVTRFKDDVAYDEGIDLRNQTSIKDAAAILQHAKFTLGLDNGQLHLAALMRDSKIIFGYNITTIEHREPRRNHGRTINIAISKKDLDCANCQSRLVLYPVHKFTHCLYRDNKCLDILFLDQQSRWFKAIDEMVSS